MIITRRHDSWWFDLVEKHFPDFVAPKNEQDQEENQVKYPKQNRLSWKRYQASLRQKFAKTYKTQEKAETKEEESYSYQSDDYDLVASFQDFSSDSE